MMNPYQSPQGESFDRFQRDPQYGVVYHNTWAFVFFFLGVACLAVIPYPLLLQNIKLIIGVYILQLFAFGCFFFSWIYHVDEWWRAKQRAMKDE